MQGWLERSLELALTGLGLGLAMVAFAAWIYLLDRIMMQRVVRRFGWMGCLVTGWLGTPVHELSHVVGCWLFGHRIERVVLFRPDLRNQRLGYVLHSYDRRNAFQEVGNLAIAMAPLVGGGVVTLVAMRLCFPELDWWPVQWNAPGALSTTGPWPMVSAAAQWVGHLGGQLVRPERLGELRFWIFLYMATCVACHAAPSREDYASAQRAIAWLGLGGTLILIVAGATPATTVTLQSALAAAMGWLAAYFLIASTLALLAAGMVFAATTVWDALREFLGRART